MVNTCTR